MSSDSIVTSRRRVEIQSTSEMTPSFTMTKCNKLFITYLTRSTERLPSLPSSFSNISTISMTVVMFTLFKTKWLENRLPALKKIAYRTGSRFGRDIIRRTDRISGRGQHRQSKCIDCDCEVTDGRITLSKLELCE